jgi:hypothetical protein
MSESKKKKSCSKKDRVHRTIGELIEAHGMEETMSHIETSIKEHIKTKFNTGNLFPLREVELTNKLDIDKKTEEIISLLEKEYPDQLYAKYLPKIFVPLTDGSTYQNDLAWDINIDTQEKTDLIIEVLYLNRHNINGPLIITFRPPEYPNRIVFNLKIIKMLRTIVRAKTDVLMGLKLYQVRFEKNDDKDEFKKMMNEFYMLVQENDFDTFEIKGMTVNDIDFDKLLEKKLLISKENNDILISFPANGIKLNDTYEKILELAYQGQTVELTYGHSAQWTKFLQYLNEKMDSMMKDLYGGLIINDVFKFIDTLQKIGKTKDFEKKNPTTQKVIKYRDNYLTKTFKENLHRKVKRLFLLFGNIEWIESDVVRQVEPDEIFFVELTKFHEKLMNYRKNMLEFVKKFMIFRFNQEVIEMVLKSITELIESTPNGLTFQPHEEFFIEKEYKREMTLISDQHPHWTKYIFLEVTEE